MNNAYLKSWFVLGALLFSGFVSAEEKSFPLPPDKVVITNDKSGERSFDPVTIRNKYKKDSYSNFRFLNAEKVIDQSDLAAGSLFLGEGDFQVNNPLVIDDKVPVFFIHGLDRMHSKLLPLHPGKPLFVIRNAEYVSFANLHLAGFSELNGTNIQVEGVSKVVFDLVDCFIEKGSLSFQAPGSYRLQGSYFTGQGVISSQIILDNDLADLFIFGGNITRSGLDQGGIDREFSHVWVKAGRFRIFGTGVQASIGLADFRIDKPALSGQGHQIVNVRSEGNNGKTKLGSSLLYVPDASGNVNVDIVNSAGAWGLSGFAKSVFAIYNGTGRLQLIGNASSEGVGQLVSRSVQSGYQLVATANTIASPLTRTSLASIKTMQVANLYANTRIGGRIVANPIYKMESAGDEFSQVILDIDIPPLLSRPTLDSALPGMASVKDFGAYGNGVADDSQAIQNAINGRRAVYFPPGIYKITQSIKYNVDPKYDHGAGGFFAGSGSDKVTILREEGGTIFQTNGMAYATLQGLTLKSKSAGPVDADNAALALEYSPGVGHATQSNSFYDLTIDGAGVGIAIGNASPTQCSENIFSKIVVKDTKFAISVGSYNALANIFADVRMQNVGTAIGQGGRLTGGSWSVVGGDFNNVESLFSFVNSADGIYFADNIRVSGTPLFSTNNTGAIFNVFFNKSSLKNTTFDLRSAGGIFINRSSMQDVKGSAHGSVSENYIINNSDFKLRENVQVGNGSVILGQ